jgi:hypothetical protein
MDSPEWFAIGIRGDWPELVSILNKGIASFSKQEIHAIISKWSYLPQKTKAIELTSDESAWLAQNHTVRVRVTHFPPYIFLDEDKPRGILFDYLELISERAGVNFTFVEEIRGFWAAVEGMANLQGPDLILGMMRDPAWEDKVLFSNDVMSSPHVIFRRTQTKKRRGEGVQFPISSLLLKISIVSVLSG